MNLSMLSIFLVLLFFVRNADGCLVVNPRSTTVSTTEVTSTGSTTSGSTQSTVSQSTVTQSSQSTVSQSTDSTVTHSTQSTLSHDSTDLDFTTTISRGTTEEDCTAYCNNPDNILISENTRFEKPSALKLPNENDDICGTYMVSCDAPGGQYCDRINLIASQTGSFNLVQLADQDQVSVRGIVVCSGNGVFRPDGASEEDKGFYDMTCMYTNCRNGTVPTTTGEPTTSTAVATTEAKSCATCDIQKIFNYANRTGKFQPWYYDIPTDYNCMCKAVQISCELYDVDTCDSHRIMIRTHEDEELIMTEVTAKKVSWPIYCHDNGKYGPDPLLFMKFVDIKEIWCASTNCRNFTAYSTIEPPSCTNCDIQRLFNWSNGTGRFQPQYSDVPNTDNSMCKAHSIQCEVPDADTCDSLELLALADDGQKIVMQKAPSNMVSSTIYCRDDGEYRYGHGWLEALRLREVFCVSSNCTKTTPSVTTSTVEPTTTEARNCKTCQAPTLFDYSGDIMEFFQPWYRDVDGGNCNCKFNEFSCEVFGNVSCNLSMEYRDTDGNYYILAESQTPNKVAGQVACADSGYWEIDGKQLTQIFCTKLSCV
ncbi:unnamed protein product [Caenorhabditis brenneri]